MKIYISGPISGTDDFMERFTRAEKALNNKHPGCEVVNPARELADKDFDLWEEYMGESLKMLCGCDTILMMRNWLFSRGAKIERMVAEQLHMNIIEEVEL